MNVVLDINILFSALLQNRSAFAEEIFLAEADFLCPHFTMVELFKHKERIVQLSNMTEPKVLELLYRLLEQIQFVNESQLELVHRQAAYDLCHDIDLKDVHFVALTLQTDG